jgi:hypothetical protein
VWVKDIIEIILCGLCDNIGDNIMEWGLIILGVGMENCGDGCGFWRVAEGG